MAQYYTDQDRIDAQTMRIENPNIVGSGYIQFPPQRPFEKPVQMQPPTVAHLEYPQEYQQYTSTGQPVPQPTAASSVQQPQANGNARAPTTPVMGHSTYSSSAQPGPSPSQRQGQAPAGRQGYAAASAQHNAGAAQPPGGGYTSQQGGSTRAQQPQHAPLASGQRQQPHQQPHQASAAAQRPTHAPSPQHRPAAPTTTYHTPAPQARAAGAASVPVPRPTAALTSVAPPPPAATVPSNEKGDDDDNAAAGLSKAQRQRLRKKMREGKA